MEIPQIFLYFSADNLSPQAAHSSQKSFSPEEQSLFSPALRHRVRVLWQRPSFRTESDHHCCYTCVVARLGAARWVQPESRWRWGGEGRGVCPLKAVPEKTSQPQPDFHQSCVNSATFSQLFLCRFNFWESVQMAQRIKRLPAMQETQVRSLGWEDPLEKEMATHSSILAWRIPWTEEPGGLQSMGSQRVRNDWVTSHSLPNIFGSHVLLNIRPLRRES